MYSVQKTITHISSSRHTQKVIDIYQGNREQLNVSVDCFSYHCIMNNFCSIVFILCLQGKSIKLLYSKSYEKNQISKK